MIQGEYSVGTHECKIRIPAPCVIHSRYLSAAACRRLVADSTNFEVPPNTWLPFPTSDVHQGDVAVNLIRLYVFPRKVICISCV